MFSQKSFRMKQDDKFFSKILSRESFRVNSSSRVFYYGQTPGDVPFLWESQPGTPITGNNRIDEERSSPRLPPLTPPPPRHSGSLSGMTPNFVLHKKKSRPKVVLCAIFSKLTTKKAHMTPSPSRSSTSSSSSSNWSRSRFRLCVHDLDVTPTAMDHYMARNAMMLRQRESWIWTRS